MLIKSLPLCSRCAFHELSSWFYEKSAQLDSDVLKQISLEMRAIKLKAGKCLVCGNQSVADGCFENIVKILEKNESHQEITEEFMRMFGICEKCIKI